MKYRILVPLLLLATVLLGSCSSNPFMDLNSIKEKLNIRDFPAQGDYPDNDGVVLYENNFEDIILNNDGDFGTIKHIHKITKLFKNIENYSSVDVMVPGGSKLLYIRARVVNPDGKIIELKPEDFHDVLEESESSGMRIIKFTYPSVDKNSIVEYDYKMYEKYPIIMDVWNIEGKLPKLWETYSLNVPYILLMKKVDGGVGWGWRYKAYNCSIPSPTVKNDSKNDNILDKQELFSWDLKNVPAFDPEPMMPPHNNFLKYVKFKPIMWETWKDVAGFYYTDHFKPNLQITNAVSDKAKEITKDCTNETDKIKCIYDFVQKLRYVDIDLREGNIDPYEPEKVLNLKKGDCTDKTMLLVAMYKSLGIQSEPVLALTKDEGKIDESFPCWNFNLMMVKVKSSDGNEYWLDPSAKHAPLGYLPSNSEHIGVLVMHDNGSSDFENTPGNTSRDNIENFYMKLDFSNADSMTISVSAKYKGEMNQRYKNYFTDKTHSEILKFCKSMISDFFFNAEVTDYGLSNLDSNEADLKLEFTAKSPNIMTQQSNLTFISTDEFKLPVELEWLGRPKRTYDIEFSYPYTIFKSLEIILPQNKYIVKELPKDLSLNGKALTYLRTFYNYGNEKIMGTEKFSVNQTDIKVDYFEKVRDFFDNIKTKSDEKIILTTK